ncbi:hypothetical protein G5V59_25065 [Nocardioides sp. W3-2-3]|uniref:hypothetical protein n=1 Tax=Nocardioides convexus TaxID=2712224 RepID=UPI0024184CC4|nr:hypothetical protein [Nocardioides convexus]NHA01829.1 hypothetical protein [Nocardioides convexus]
MYQCTFTSVEERRKFTATLSAEVPQVFTAQGSTAFEKARSECHASVNIIVSADGVKTNIPTPADGWTPATILSVLLPWFNENMAPKPLEAYLMHYRVIDPAISGEVPVSPDVFAQACLPLRPVLAGAGPLPHLPDVRPAARGRAVQAGWRRRSRPTRPPCRTTRRRSSLLTSDTNESARHVHRDPQPADLLLPGDGVRQERASAGPELRRRQGHGALELRLQQNQPAGRLGVQRQRPRRAGLEDRVARAHLQLPQQHEGPRRLGRHLQLDRRHRRRLAQGLRPGHRPRHGRRLRQERLRPRLLVVDRLVLRRGHALPHPARAVRWRTSPTSSSRPATT